MDERTPKRIKKLLSSAAMELRAAGIDFLGEFPVFTEVACHCTAAIEESLMAFLAFRRKECDPGADLPAIAEACAEADQTMKKTVYRVLIMKQYKRGAEFECNAEEARETIILAEKVFQAVLERIPSEMFK